jgi:hypothetical protein
MQFQLEDYEPLVRTRGKILGLVTGAGICCRVNEFEVDKALLLGSETSASSEGMGCSVGRGGKAARGCGSEAATSVVESVEGVVNMENGVGFPAWDNMTHPPRKVKILLIKIQKRSPNLSGFIM